MRMTATAVSADCLYRQMLTTPLGRMLTITNRDELLLLEFDTLKDLDGQLELLRQIDSRPIVEQSNSILRLAQQELDAYFSGCLLYTSPSPRDS